jgi:hypothetical protein
MSCFKVIRIIFFAAVVAMHGCSNTSPQEELTITETNNTPEKISVFKSGTQTVSHFDVHGRAFVVPAGYRLSLDDYFHSSYPDTQVKINQKPNTDLTTAKTNTNKSNVWERYCNQGDISLTEVEAIERSIQEHGLPKQYVDNCRPGYK